MHLDIFKPSADFNGLCAFAAIGARAPSNISPKELRHALSPRIAVIFAQGRVIILARFAEPAPPVTALRAALGIASMVRAKWGLVADEIAPRDVLSPIRMTEMDHHRIRLSSCGARDLPMASVDADTLIPRLGLSPVLVPFERTQGGAA